MSRVALLMDINPSKLTQGPTVRLAPGLYVLNGDGLVDSEVAVYQSIPNEAGLRIEPDSDKLALLDFTDIHVKIIKPGNERSFSLYIRKID